MELFLKADTWLALLTLCFLEIVLGIDNIIFISITSNKLPEEFRKRARNTGLLLAMVSGSSSCWVSPGSFNSQNRCSPCRPIFCWTTTRALAVKT